MCIHAQTISACFLICLAIPAVPVCEASGPEEKGKTVSVVFRYDDYSSRSDTDFEARLIRIFAERGMKVTLGVVPFMVEGDETDPSPQRQVALNADKVDLLVGGMAAGILEIAQHGYSHRTYKKYARGNLSEFRGMPYEEQQKKIAEGKSYLEEVLGLASQLTVFIPTFNKYDVNTLKAVEKAGFSVFSPGHFSLSDKNSGLTMLPETIDLINLKSAVVSAEGSGCESPLVVVLFHPYDFVEVDPQRGIMTEPQFGELLDWVSSRPKIRSLFISEAADNPAYDISFFNKNKLYFRSYQKVWPFMQKLLKIETGFYICPAEMKGQQTKVWIYLVLYSLTLLAAALLISIKIFGFVLDRLWILGIFLFVLSLIFYALALLYVLKDSSVTHLGFTLILLSTGTILGGLRAVLKRAKS
jgi:peptidoglycan/xylan/chitin deacetylase (PgdA/CDA1 family)